MNEQEVFNTANAIFASASHTHTSYRTGFDASLPFYSPNLYDLPSKILKDKKYLLIVSNELLTFKDQLILQEKAEYDNQILILNECPKKAENIPTDIDLSEFGLLCRYSTKEKFSYPSVLEIGQFCLVTLNGIHNHFTLIEALAADCIPVVVNDIQVMPYYEVSSFNLLVKCLPY